MTAMMLLVANSMHKPRHDNLFLDNHLVENGLQIVNKMVKETDSELLRSFQITCSELHQRTQEKCALAADDFDWASFQ
jgi:hypothetical protein